MEQLLGMLGGAVLGGQQDKRNYDQANRIGRLNNVLGMEMGNYNYGKQLEMWKATGPVGQMEQLKKAGLNAALMYGKSGPGGMLAAPATAGHTSAQTGDYSREIGMGMQLATGLQQAQIENLNADTEKKKADAKKTAGVDTEQTTWQNKILEIENNFRKDGYAATVAKLKYETDIQLQKLHQERNNAFISDNTVRERMEIIQGDAAAAILKGAAAEAGIELTKAETEGIYQGLKQQWKRLAQGDRELDQKDKHILIDQERNKLIDKGIEWGAASRAIGDVLSIMTPKKAAPIINNTENKTINNKNFDIHKY